MKKIFFSILVVQLILVGVFVFMPDLVGAASNCPDGESGRVCLTNPFAATGLTEPRDVVRAGFFGFGSIIALVAIAFVVFAGFKMVLSSTEEARKSAQEGLKWAVGGYLVALIAFTIIASVANSIGFQPSLVGENELKNPISIPGGEAASRDFIAIMFFIMSNVLGLLGFATILMLIYYGFRYITSFGNEEAFTAAKDGIKWSLIGFALALFGFTIITIIRRFFLGI